MEKKRKKIYQDKFKEILSKSDYPKNTVIKVRIFFKDLHYISFKDGKIRTNRFEVLEEVN